jgi:glutamate/tyrosine decarboxylase-like PLP-dependent enzyme
VISPPVAARELAAFKVHLPTPAEVGGIWGAMAIPEEVRFALIVDPHRKPVAFHTVQDLARSIHRRRAGATIQLFSTRVPMRDRPEGARVVKVTTLHEGLGYRFLGMVWLGGDRQSQSELRDALSEVQPAFGRAA